MKDYYLVGTNEINDRSTFKKVTTFLPTLVL